MNELLNLPHTFCIACAETIRPKLPGYGYVGAGVGSGTPLFKTWDRGMSGVCQGYIHQFKSYIYNNILRKREPTLM